MGTMFTLLLSLAVIAAFAIGSGGIYILIRRPEDRKKGWLMLAVGVVTLGNIALLTAPVAGNG